MIDCIFLRGHPHVDAFDGGEGTTCDGPGLVHHSLIFLHSLGIVIAIGKKKSNHYLLKIKKNCKCSIYNETENVVDIK